VKESVLSKSAAEGFPPADAPLKTPPLSWQTTLGLAGAAVAALVVHLLISGSEPPAETHAFTVFTAILLGLVLLVLVAQFFWSGLRQRLRETGPIIAAAFVLMVLWEIITTGIRLLPLPYFPSPARVIQSMIDDRIMIWDSTWHSLILLIGGYALGVCAGVVSGVCIGWFSPVRYWGMPVLKVVGPIPATAWIPLALVVSPSAVISATCLIALAVWFPVTMLTASGISNTRVSYLDVARTLGARPSFLIFRVAIPAAMPNIFIGLFMGLGSAFLTLVVAETVGVKSGLGWYLSWAREWAEYGKVYAALVIMAVFFSSIMSLLFKVRDRVLVWQKGVIKW
jgi:NitT/TauT family transport system permease protein